MEQHTIVHVYLIHHPPSLNSFVRPLKPPSAPSGRRKKEKNKERNRAIKLKHRGLFEGLWVYILLYVVPYEPVFTI